MICQAVEAGRREPTIKRASHSFAAVATLIALLTLSTNAWAVTPLLTGESNASSMPGGVAGQRFTLTDKERKSVTEYCIANSHRPMSKDQLRRGCGCLAQTVQWSVTRKEFDTYIAWLKWQSSWFKGIKIEEPKAVTAKISAGSARCSAF